MAVTDQKATAHNARGRYLEVQLNGAGLHVGIDSYELIKDEPEYTEEKKLLIPEMNYDTATIVNNSDSNGRLLNHTVTLATGIPLTQDMIDNPNKQVVYLFNKTSAETKAKAGDLKDLSTDDYSFCSEIADPTTVFGGTLGTLITTFDTVGATKKSTKFTHTMILGNDGYVRVAQLTDYNDEETKETIPVDNADSGGWKATIDGLKSGDVGDIGGVYDPGYPSLATLSAAADNYQTVRMRLGALRKKYAPYKIGLYTVNNFSTTGATDGSAYLAYSCGLSLQPNTIVKKSYTED